MVVTSGKAPKRPPRRYQPQEDKNFVEAFIKCPACGAAMWQHPHVVSPMCLSDVCRAKPPPPPRGPSRATALKAGESPATPAGRKRVPSNTPYTTSWPRTSPDILDKLKALVLRFIDWLNNESGVYEDDKHIADGEHMATLAELFEEVEEVAKPKPPRPHQPPGNTSTARQGAWPALWTSVTVTTKSTDKE